MARMYVHLGIAWFMASFDNVAKLFLGAQAEDVCSVYFSVANEFSNNIRCSSETEIEYPKLHTFIVYLGENC